MKFTVEKGKRFGELTAEMLVDTECLYEFTDRTNRIWICSCSCGGHILARAKDLASNRVHHCNQCSRTFYEEPKLQDLTDKIYGDLRVIKMMPFEAKGYPGGFWKPSYAVECKCGKRFVINAHSLTSGFRTCCPTCEGKKYA